MGLFEQFRTLVGRRGDAGIAPSPVPAPVQTPPPGEAAAAPAAARSVERRQRKRVNARSGTRILIIDDSPTVVAALKKMLRGQRYEVLEADSAELGLALMATARPELVFLDIILPGMNGFAALRKIRRDPVLAETPVIMISGNEHATEQYYANRIGADDFMKKPFSRYEVFARIERLLDAERVPRRPVAAA